MTKPLIVVSDGFDKNLFDQLRSNSNLNVHEKSKLTKEELYAILPNVEGLIIRSATTVNDELLAVAPKLKLVIRAGEGTDNIDKKACAAKGVKVANTPGANNNSAAEHAIALMMSALREIPMADASMKEGKWDKARFMGLELWKKKLGVVGFGRIGQIVAKRLAGFEITVNYFDPNAKTDIPYAKKAETLEEVFSNSDIITLHTPLMDSTKNMVNEKLLGLMKPNAILVNASRGGIVDEEALYNALKNKKIRGAAFDVFKSEPLEAGSKLLELDNFIMTPHLGATTAEAQERVGEMAVHQIEEFFINNNLLNEVKA